jgi:hypothetical protein
MQKSKSEIMEAATKTFSECLKESFGNYDSMMEPENQPNNSRIDRIESMCWNLQQKADKILREAVSEMVNNNGEQSLINKKKAN